MFTVVFVVAKNTKMSASFSENDFYFFFIHFCHDISKDILLKILFVCYRLELMYQTS